MNEGESGSRKSSQSLQVVNVCTLIGGVGLLTLSLWPGYVIGCLLFLAYPLIALLVVVWLFIVIRALPKPAGRGERILLRQMLFAPVIVCVTFFLLVFYIPRRVAFRLCMGQFERQLNGNPAASQPVAMNRWLGIYRVDEIGADPRGGVYFRTGTAADMIDTISYGFAHHPNSGGSPFGNANYRLHPIAPGWYWFETSNDW